MYLGPDFVEIGGCASDQEGSEEYARDHLIRFAIGAKKRPWNRVLTRF